MLQIIKFRAWLRASGLNLIMDESELRAQSLEAQAFWAFEQFVHLCSRVSYFSYKCSHTGDITVDSKWHMKIEVVFPLAREPLTPNYCGMPPPPPHQLRSHVSAECHNTLRAIYGNVYFLMKLFTAMQQTRNVIRYIAALRYVTTVQQYTVALQLYTAPWP